MGLKEAYERRTGYAPHIGITPGFISGVSYKHNESDFLYMLESSNRYSNLGWVDFTYYVPIINKNIGLDSRKECVRYVVGAEIDLAEFKKILEMKCMNLNLERNFYEKIKSASSVCLIRPLKDNRNLPQKVLVVDKNTKVFNTLEELIEASKEFVYTMNEFFQIVRVENYLKNESLSLKK